MSGATKRADGVFTISWGEYQATHKDFAGIWTTERPDITDGRDLLGRRTLLVYDQGTCLAIEGRGLHIEGAPAALRVVRDERGEWRVERYTAADGHEWRRRTHPSGPFARRSEATIFARSLVREGMGELTYVEVI